MTDTPASYAAAIDRLDALTRRFASAAERVSDWEAPVPACPRWTTRKLLVHLGLIHAWAASAIGASAAPPEARFDLGDAPLPTWYRARAGELVATLRASAPDSKAWTLWGERVAAFWARRQVHETTVHTFDLAQSLAAGAGEPPSDLWTLPEDVALDGIHEVVEGFYPRQLRLGRTAGLPAVVRLEVRTDDGELLETLALPPRDESAEAPLLGTLSGTASQLYLGLWGRTPLPGADDQLAEAIREARLTP
ncbi:maleylpyruvate isomerase N-terminal domain-containing protein [Sinomonas terrae]|uniref:Maleylpyruvate isomerase N-terminal domain-containing protein n=1 Tax=Sinomonas terrae TaxID=2908838 RepID=A0ABS9U3P7_9MICC|nr:maleylpyruvate isomerase N-terminal domain-containing protein [Sinomonas terrae]MCH6471313.1 maleylpyruvate isomerase N-terminal domain-containing protein [Sinomonas terrae]